MRQQVNRRIAATIVHGNERLDLYADGGIGRPAIHMQPSGEWKVTGAVELNNFGGVVRRYSLAEIVRNPSAIPWKFKNGKQRTHVTDLDHGHKRMWASPDHYIY